MINKFLEIEDEIKDMNVLNNKNKSRCSPSNYNINDSLHSYFITSPKDTVQEVPETLITDV
jgi:hypothetical protein